MVCSPKAWTCLKLHKKWEWRWWVCGSALTEEEGEKELKFDYKLNSSWRFQKQACMLIFMGFEWRLKDLGKESERAESDRWEVYHLWFSS